jgi:hypothetical protein
MRPRGGVQPESQRESQRESQPVAQSGESMVEAVVALLLLAAGVMLLGSGASLWQTGTQWSVARYEAIRVANADLALWPPEPQEICGLGEPEAWWEQMTSAHSLRWDQPEVWTSEQSWMAVPIDSCEWIASGEVRVIKLRGELLDTVLSVQRP